MDRPPLISKVSIERAAVAMWRHEGARAAPRSIAERRTHDAFLSESREMQERWIGLAEAALSSVTFES